MEPPSDIGLAALHARLDQPGSWLGGPGSLGFSEHLEKVRRRLDTTASPDPPASGPVVVAEALPAHFLAAALATIARSLPVALARPHWSTTERAQAAAQLRPGNWFGPDAPWPDVYPQTNYDPAAWRGAILIPTGGSGGRVRWAIHDWGTLAAAARALETFLGDGPFTHVSTLPPWHVSGLMPAVRALETGGQLWLDDWKSVEGGTPPTTDAESAVISLVPTQLLRLLDKPALVEWLRSTRAILLGGAAPPPGLLERAREFRLPVALAYGLTETAAAAAVQPPADFLAGEPPAVTPLSHARLWIADETGEPRLPNAPGRVWVEAESLFRGYYPTRRAPGPFATDDDGELDIQGRLRLLGRRDRLIVTGGEKVDPRLVEEALRATGLIEEALVAGAPDPEWGRRVIAIYTGAPRPPAELRAAVEGVLPPAAVPKNWIHAARLPLDERGKVDRAALAALLAATS
jgi:O-succinylbenzoic acid--CoA ligase